MAAFSRPSAALGSCGRAAVRYGMSNAGGG
jgi:hypothetical protein